MKQLQKVKCRGILAIAVLLFAVANIPANQVGKFTYKKNPENLNNDTILLNDTALAAGDTINLSVRITDCLGRPVADTALPGRVTWRELSDSLQPGDTGIGNNDTTVRFTGTLAWKPRRFIQVTLTLPNGTLIRDTMKVAIVPALPSHVIIEGSNHPLVVSPNLDNPLGGPLQTITLGPTVTRDSMWAVLRDRFQNFNSFSTHTGWFSSNPALITASRVDSATGKWIIIINAGSGGTARLIMLDSTCMSRDTITVNVDSAGYDSLRIMWFSVAVGRIIPISQLTLVLPDSITLYVEGRRADRIGPNGGWVQVSGDWAIDTTWPTTRLRTTRLPPQNQYSWSFAPRDTGTGTISVSLNSGTILSSSIPVHFLVDRSWCPFLGIYPRSGAPGINNALYPSDPAYADTIFADSIFTLLYAKLFNACPDFLIWLSEYETNDSLARQIKWSISPVPEDTLTDLAGYHTSLKARRAVPVTVTATWLYGVSYSVRIFVIPRPSRLHFVVEASPLIRDPYNDDPLSLLTIQGNQTQGRAYAVFRDQWGNYVCHSQHTRWRTTNSCILVSAGDTTIGEVIVTRNANNGTALLIGEDAVTAFPDTLRDTVQVTLVTFVNVGYLKFRIYSFYPTLGKIYPDTVRIATDDSLALYVEGQRQDDTTRWDNITANYWRKDATLKTKTPPLTNSNRWTVLPDSIGQGWIKATKLSIPDPLAQTDSVWAIFTEGAPSRMTLYQGLGNPQTVSLLPSTDTVAAGSITTIVTKVFDRNNIWLYSYENISQSQGIISWTTTKLSGPNGGGSDTIVEKAGHITHFTPRFAYSTYRITANFSSGGISLQASAIFYVTPPVGIDSDQLRRPQPDIFSAFPDNGAIRVLLPGKAALCALRVNVYSLTGSVAYSRMTTQRDLSIRLPAGVYVVRVEGLGVTKRVALISQR